MKYLLLTILAIFIFLAAGLVAVVVLVDPNQYKDQIATAVEKNTGRNLQIPGDLSLSIFPWIGVKTGEVTLGNAAGFGPEPFAEVQKAEIKVKLLPLLRKKVEIKHLVLEKLQLNLAKTADGRTNWEDLTAARAPTKTEPETAPKAPTPVPPLLIGGVTLDDSSVTWQDRHAGRTVQVQHLNARLDQFRFGNPTDFRLGFVLQLDEPSLKETVSLKTTVLADEQLQRFELHDLHLQSHSEGEPVPSGRLEAMLDGSLKLDLAAQTLTATDLQLQAADAELTGALEGEQILDAPKLRGDFRLEAALPKVLTALGVELPQPANAEAPGKTRLDFNLKAEVDHLALTDLRGNLDDTQLNGELAVTSFAQPKINLQLKADDLDLDRYLPAKSAPAPAKEAAAEKAPEQPLPFAALAGLNMDGRIQIGQLKVKGLQMQGVTLTALGKNRVMTLTPTIDKFYQGNYQGQVRLDGRAQIPQVSLSSSMKNVQIEPLLQDMTGKAQLSGTAFLDLNLAGRGSKVSDIQKTLDGKVAFQTQNGSLNNVQILRLIKHGEAWWKGKEAPAETQIEKLQFVGLDFLGTVQNGIMNTDRFLIDSRKLRIQGSGTVDLAQEQLDYSVRVDRLKHEEGETGEEIATAKSLPIIIKISGPLAEPKYGLDVVQMAQEKYKSKIQEKQTEIQEKIQEKKGKIEEKVTEELEKKLGEGAGEMLKGLLR
ncbi:MAG: AsmA family protein [Methylothermaceae bacterium]|nr:AsmA family protein [Methylothermaceae bacterium]